MKCLCFCLRKRKSKHNFCVEIDFTSSGDILEKIKKYEALNWLRKAKNKTPICLCVAYKKKATRERIEGYTGELMISLYHIEEVAEKWKWWKREMRRYEKAKKVIEQEQKRKARQEKLNNRRIKGVVYLTDYRKSNTKEPNIV